MLKYFRFFTPRPLGPSELQISLQTLEPHPSGRSAASPGPRSRDPQPPGRKRNIEEQIQLIEQQSGSVSEEQVIYIWVI